MKLNEYQIIALAEKYFIKNNSNIVKNIGDDTAVVKPVKGLQLLTSDMLIEGTHFLLDKISPYNLGWKSLAVNISDIASMSGKPDYALLSIGLNNKVNYDWLEDFYKGLSDCANTYQVNIIGGDTVSSKSDVVINIALTGNSEKPIYRNTAKENYILTSTGYLGLSGAGLKLLLSEKKSFDKYENYCIEKHVKPIPKVSEGLFISEYVNDFAMCDSSDGLYNSAKLISKQSNLGIDLFSENFSFNSNLCEVEKDLNQVIDLILYSGEDYELIFALSENDYNNLKEKYYQKFQFQLPLLGKFNNSKEIKLLKKSNYITLNDKSFNHF